VPDCLRTAVDDCNFVATGLAGQIKSDGRRTAPWLQRNHSWTAHPPSQGFGVASSAGTTWALTA